MALLTHFTKYKYDFHVCTCSALHSEKRHTHNFMGSLEFWLKETGGQNSIPSHGCGNTIIGSFDSYLREIQLTVEEKSRCGTATLTLIKWSVCQPVFKLVSHQSHLLCQCICSENSLDSTPRCILWGNIELIQWSLALLLVSVSICQWVFWI